jgi:membrane protease YdiL (CAAX protease family)
VVLFGLGLTCLRVLLRPKSAFQRWSLSLGWAVVCALVFSAWHHVGAYGDALDARVFVFRAVCALVFTLIYATRGFAPTVWTHVSYDVWVLAF